MKTAEDLLKLMGAKNPLIPVPAWCIPDSDMPGSILTKEGDAAFKKLREILIDLQDKGIIVFNEDKLDRFIFSSDY